jgi:hypothetical protein
MPEVPAPDTLRSIEELIAPQDRAQRHRFWENFDVRPINWVPWAQRTPGRRRREWYRYRPRTTFDDPSSMPLVPCCSSIP